MAACWFCENRFADLNSALKVQLTGKKIGTRKTGPKQYTTSYEARSVNVPRCKECEINHRKKRKGSLINGFIGTIGILALLFSVYTYGIIKIVLIILGDFGILALVLLSVRLGLSTRDTGSESKAREFPEVKELRKQGWKY